MNENIKALSNEELELISGGGIFSNDSITFDAVAICAIFAAAYTVTHFILKTTKHVVQAIKYNKAASKTQTK